jgi:hypothetical protein
MEECTIPVFVAVAECKDKVRQFLHDSLGCSVHDVEPILVIWLEEFIFGRKPIRALLAMAA